MQKTNHDGITIVNTYDALGQLKAKAAAGQALVAYFYDLAGRQTEIHHGGAREDTSIRSGVTGTAPAMPVVVGSAYDQHSNLTQYGGETFSSDSENRLTAYARPSHTDLGVRRA